MQNFDWEKRVNEATFLRPRKIRDDDIKIDLETDRLGLLGLD
jgi:hypothetical protein